MCFLDLWTSAHASLDFWTGGTERIYLQSIEHDYIRILKSQSYKQMSTYSRPDSAGLGIRGSWQARVLFPLVVTFFTGFFCFHVVKSLMPILALYWHYCQLCLITKNSNTWSFQGSLDKSPETPRQETGEFRADIICRQVQMSQVMWELLLRLSWETEQQLSFRLDVSSGRSNFFQHWSLHYDINYTSCFVVIVQLRMFPKSTLLKVGQFLHCQAYVTGKRIQYPEAKPKYGGTFSLVTDF